MPPPPSRPAVQGAMPWSILLMSVAAVAAMMLTEGPTVSAAVLLLLLVAGRFAPVRVGDAVTQAGPVFLALVIGATLLRGTFPATRSDSMLDPDRLALVADTGLALVVLQAWRRNRASGSRGALLVFISGILMLAASNTFETAFAPWFVPAYALLLLRAVRDMRPHDDPPEGLSSRRRVVVRGAAWAAAVLLGAAGSGALTVYKTPITEWGMRLLREIPRTPDAVGLSGNPRLGPSWSRALSLERILQIRGAMPSPHLRGLSFTDYERGAWLPGIDQRQLRPASPAELAPEVRGRLGEAVVTRSRPLDGLVCAPLNMAGLVPADLGVEALWAPELGGPVRLGGGAPVSYTLRLPENERSQGPLCVPPTPADRARMLEAPGSLDPRVRALAIQIVGREKRPERKALAIAQRLMADHAYSLEYRLGGGDPVSDFVLSRKPSYCEYFASAATLMLRCVGVPSRYVVGYYAHEPDGPDGLVVRQRDAHAWCEAWIDGVGWVTVEATPASGLPDQAAEAIPWCMRLQEWLQRQWEAASAALAGPSGMRLAACLGALLLGLLGVRLARKRRGRAAESMGRLYTEPSPRLRAIARRFREACAPNVADCPDTVPWLAHVRQHPGAPASEAAARFVSLYNEQRFGGETPGGLADLEAMLDQLEHEGGA
ncbi:MAG: transglutaminase-like domain-containing protein [Armatimonadetes bacterium]|nr:transglutaminase-like domain-containing protein [Armatimonadota bacterium]